MIVSGIFQVMLLLCTSLPIISAFSQPRTSSCSPGYNITDVAKEARNLASHSWEYGTAAEAFLELYNPELSVFGTNPFPGNDIPSVNWANVDALAYVKPIILTNNQTLVNGDGAVGDPCSVGVSAVLIGQTDKVYLEAASREVDYVVNIAPRAWNGAISHRTNTPELWADFVYMAPPFLAYYAVATTNATLLKFTIQQCGLYRQILQANISTTGNQSAFQGIWEHIIGPNDYQPQFWSTGNGWAAAGMARVLATTLKWGPSSSWTVEQASLKLWIKEIIDGAMDSPQEISVDPSDGLLRNYLNDTTWFGETSGTALLSSTVYRMAILAPEIFAENKYIAWADQMREAVALHVKANGTLSPAINPLDFGSRIPKTTGSPEGQSFGVMLYSAYRDWACT